MLSLAIEFVGRLAMKTIIILLSILSFNAMVFDFSPCSIFSGRYSKQIGNNDTFLMKV